MTSGLRFAVLLVLIGCGFVGCDDSDPPKSSQGKWLEACQSDDQCGDASEGLSCICGTCSKSCEDDTACEETPQTSICFTSNTSTTFVLCGGDAAAKSLCLPECDPEVPDICGAGQACIQGACITLAALPTQFFCGTQSCQVGQQYCYSESGGASPDNSSVECKSIPAACLPTPTCECLSDNGESFTSCQEVWPGAIQAYTDFPSSM